MLIAYATAEGELASDAGTDAGPYAKVLADEIVEPGIEAVYMFRRVQVRVRSTIGQEPWLGFSALGEVHLAGLQAQTPKPAATPPVESLQIEAERAWAATKDTTNIAALELFTARYKETYYAGLARLRIQEMKKQQVANATPALPPLAPAANPPKPGRTDWFKDCPNCPEMVVVPAGRFTMGSPKDEPERGDNEDQVSVTIGKPFVVGRFAVTDAVVGPSRSCQRIPNRGAFPFADTVQETSTTLDPRPVGRRL
jgi:hypothetical protein